MALYNAIPLDEPEAMAARARAFLADGYRRLQVKVGTDARVDVERLLAVRDAVGDSVVLFADANGGFTLAEARRSCGPPVMSSTRLSSRARAMRSAALYGMIVTGRWCSTSRLNRWPTSCFLIAMERQTASPSSSLVSVE